MYTLTSSKSETRHVQFRFRLRDLMFKMQQPCQCDLSSIPHLVLFMTQLRNSHIFMHILLYTS